jgi:hypothetical protein
MSSHDSSTNGMSGSGSQAGRARSWKRSLTLLGVGLLAALCASLLLASAVEKVRDTADRMK